MRGMQLMRYPGSKAKLVRKLQDLFPSEMVHRLWSNAERLEYREPFVGAGAVTFHVLKTLDYRCPIWLNDLDPGVAALWRCVHENHKSLMRKVGLFTPTVAAFDKFKAEDGDTSLPVDEAAFRKLALHQMGFSGLGYKAGSVPGGRAQGKTGYSVDCRYNKAHIKKKIARFHELLSAFKSVRITNTDFSELLVDAPTNCFAYLDPPYYERGPELYKHAMSDVDHKRLAALLQNASCHWLLSYDDHAFIRSLYSWADFTPLPVVYTNAITGGTRPKNHEVAITPRHMMGALSSTTTHDMEPCDGMETVH